MSSHRRHRSKIAGLQRSDTPGEITTWYWTFNTQTSRRTRGAPPDSPQHRFADGTTAVLRVATLRSNTVLVTRAQEPGLAPVARLRGESAGPRRALPRFSPATLILPIPDFTQIVRPWIGHRLPLSLWPRSAPDFPRDEVDIEEFRHSQSRRPPSHRRPLSRAYSVGAIIIVCHVPGWRILGAACFSSPAMHVSKINRDHTKWSRQDEPNDLSWA